MKRMISIVMATVMLLLAGCVTPDLDNHNACFLIRNFQRPMNILSPYLSRDAFKSYIKDMKNMGANSVYLYTMNEHDGPWTPYSIYQNNDIGGALNMGVVEEMQWRIEYCRKEGLTVIIWLRADDSPNFNRRSIVEVESELTSDEDLARMGLVRTRAYANARTNFYDRVDSNVVAVARSVRQETYQEHACKYFVNPYASAVYVALEISESYNDATAGHYARHLQGLTDVPVLTHDIPGRWATGHQEGVDGVGVQIGFNKSEAYTQNMIARARAELPGKLVGADEYHGSSETEQAKNLGDAAMKGGAKWTGNNRHNPPEVTWIDELLGTISVLFE